MHHLENARQQRRRFQRTHPLPLQQIGQRIHLSRQLAERIRRTRTPRPKE